ncbi:MAG: thioredoxin domain-containing protein [Deltaproteobacteria bacterium]|uniref:Thioredoxin domain-containing protein n=1 Tax=Candidatus Zymogenus saltonus TaxID=2844893 RepID=A0A9D8KFR6_9DELT|nr:thioredoxin domain-containing protein [Candidatus Zymogenus saltonus]
MQKIKKVTNILLLLSGAGAVIAVVLTAAHYMPDFGKTLPFCGEAEGSCVDIYQLPYALFLGIPIAAYGLFFYLVVIFTLIAADAAGGRYYREATVILLPLCALALVIDLGLGITLIIIGELCIYCVATYAINIILFLLLIYSFKTANKAEGVSFFATLKNILKIGENERERRAIYALYMICVTLIFSSVFFLSHAFGNKTPDVKTDAQLYIDELYKAPPEAIDFPESDLVVGNKNAPLTVYVFTDFLCSACYRLYNNEQILLKRFDNQIRFVHYNYPLDIKCNESMGRTLYKNSCIASRSMLAASDAGVFSQYYEEHYLRYNKYNHNFTLEDVTVNMGTLADSILFMKYMGSPKTDYIIQRDVRLARKLGIKGTPVLFVNGRRIGGAIPVEVMEKIVYKELSSPQKENK